MKTGTQAGRSDPMIRPLLCFLLAAALCCFGAAGAVSEGLEVTDLEFPAPGAQEVFPPEEYDYSKRVYTRYESETLIYTIESFTLDSIPVLLTKIWVQDPERQIRKVNAPWGEGLANPLNLAREIPGVVLATNASGYITKQYPDIPESYPGEPSDYFFTTLGSLVITEGEILRNLDGVPFYGLALSADGISMYRGADNDMVLATSPQQTWSFFENCAMMEDGADLLPEEGTWPMAREKHPRTVLARINRNNYVLLHVMKYGNSNGASLYWINDFFSHHFRAEWVYNLDGGSSSSLIYRTQEKKPRLKRHVPNRQGIMDILCFTE